MVRKLLTRSTVREEGQALALFAGGLVILLGFVAMSIDVGRFVWARTQMQAAVDAAALAAAQSLPSTAQAAEQASWYWADNNNFIQSQGENVQFSITYPPGNKAVRVRGDADIPTWFARFLGFNSWHVSAEGDAESIVIDAVVVLDRSGSMCWDSHGPNGHYVSQVRLSTSINSSQTSFQVTRNDSSLPLSHYLYVGQVFRLESSSSSEWMRITGLTEPNTVHVQRAVPNPNNGYTYHATSHNAGRRPRGNNCQQAGAPPYFPWEYVKNGARVFVNQMNPDYDRVGYAHFSTSGASEMTLTANFASLNTAITNTADPTAYGGGDGATNIAHGMYVGSRELVENGRTNARWVMVLLSDGVANRYCLPNDYQTSCSSVGSRSSTARNRALEQADYAKDHGITIYTIGYGNNSDDWLMQEIANRTGGKFYKVPTEQELANAFISIANETHIRLSR